MIVNKLKQMRYNIYYDALLGKKTILDIDESTLKYIVKLYKNGESQILINGNNHTFTLIRYIQIFENPNNLSETELINGAYKINEYYVNFAGNKHVGEMYLSSIGEDVTNKFLGNSSFGSNKLKKNEKINSNYVNPERIEELRSCNSTFDLSKLIRMCEELNYNFTNENFYSVAMLGRAIIDHIPPIFEKKNFSEVANDIGSKSVKKNLNHLNNSMRSISDGILHSHIRRKESLPNSTQVNFSQDLDLLLGEIVSFLNTI